MEAAPPAGELGGRTHTSELAIAEPRPRGGRILCWASSPSHENREEAVPPAGSLSLLLPVVAARALNGAGLSGAAQARAGRDRRCLQFGSGSLSSSAQ
jgi:hypothetical protein